MTLKEAIDRADAVKPNAFSNDAKTAWINEAEGMVQTDVFLFAPEEIITYTYNDDKNEDLLVNDPHSKIYPAYLGAMIDFYNGEYDKYQNTMTLFNSFFGEFVRWFARTYRPADTYREVGQWQEIS